MISGSPKNHSATKLSPLPYSKNMRKRQRQIKKEKENNWVLDCINENKSKLKPYSSLRDKYLKYFVIGVPKKKRANIVHNDAKQNNYLTQNQSIPTENDFKSFLSAQKNKILQNSTEVTKQSDTSSSGLMKIEEKNSEYHTPSDAKEESICGVKFKQAQGAHPQKSVEKQKKQGIKKQNKGKPEENAEQVRISQAFSQQEKIKVNILRVSSQQSEEDVDLNEQKGKEKEEVRKKQGRTMKQGMKSCERWGRQQKNDGKKKEQFEQQVFQEEEI